LARFGGRLFAKTAAGAPHDISNRFVLNLARRYENEALHRSAGENGLEMASSEDEHAIQALSPQRADKPLRERIRLRGFDRGDEDPYSLGAEDVIEGGYILGVAIADEDRNGTVSQRATKLRACWVTQEALGLDVTPAKWTLRVAISMNTRA
jgi:hypothetical protein